jgi:S-adenosylmethionine synthetase
MAFKEIHQFFQNVIEEIDTKAKADIAAAEAEIRTIGNDVKTSFQSQEAEIIKQLQASAPEIQNAVRTALDDIAQAIAAALASHGL